MKKIQDYIDQQQFDDIDLSVLPHIAIEYKENNLHNKAHMVLEKNGVYEGCSELATVLWKDAKKRYDKGERSFEIRYKREDLKKLKNLFFSELVLDYEFNEEDDNGAEYEDNDSVNKQTMLFDEVIIDVYLANCSDLRTILMHELTHAWDNYNRLMKDNMSFYDKASSDFYGKIVDQMTSSEVEENIKRILYFTLKEERDAFVAQLAGDLENSKRKVKTPKDALQVLMKSKIYITYKLLLDTVNEYSAKDSEYKEMIARVYNDICETSLTPNKVMKKLQFLMNKSMKKINTIMGKLCVEHLDNVVTTAPTKTWL